MLFKLKLQLFAEGENPISVENPDTPRDDLSAVDAYLKLKENSVSKEEYDKLKQNYNAMIKKVISGDVLNSPSDDATVESLRKELYGGEKELSNREYIEKTLKLREKIIANGGEDPFVPNGAKYKPNANDRESAKKVAEFLQEIVDIADGNDDVFLSEFIRGTTDR